MISEHINRFSMMAIYGRANCAAACSVGAGGDLLKEMVVPDTCGTAYADKLASCTPFRCRKPSPMAMTSGIPSEAELNKMPPEQQQEIRNSMAAAEEKIAAMSPQERADMKAKMTSMLEIKGLDAHDLCQTVTVAIPGQQIDCALDKSMLQHFSEYTRFAAGAEHIQMSSTSHLVDGKMVTEQVDVIDGKSMTNPWKEALDSGQCKYIETAQADEVASKSATADRPAGTTPLLSAQEKSAEQGVNTLFVLDASGSMWGQINGKPKITIAKEVMAELIPELPDNARIGLIAYGHRRKADCEDVETLVSLGEHHQQAVLTAVKDLNALGKTPLTISVNQAIDMLRPEGDASTVVLISDGIESCGGDPCATVKVAKASGVNFILHTVGFGVSEQESAQLQCMAKAGDGEYFQANNAKELLKSARKAVKSKGPGMLKLTLRSNGKPVNAWVKLSENGSMGLAELTNNMGVEPGHIWHLKPGTYHLETLPAGLHGVDPMKLDKSETESSRLSGRH